MMRRIVRLATAALVAGGLGVAGVGLAAGTANADGGPHRWCPGEPLPPTGNHVTNPVIWDNNICHTYYYVYFGQGNVAQNIWDGDNPPAPPPRRRLGSSIRTTANRSWASSAPRVTERRPPAASRRSDTDRP